MTINTFSLKYCVMCVKIWLMIYIFVIMELRALIWYPCWHIMTKIKSLVFVTSLMMGENCDVISYVTAGLQKVYPGDFLMSIWSRSEIQKSNALHLGMLTEPLSASGLAHVPCIENQVKYIRDIPTHVTDV